jgi:hypothetical protein
VEEEVPQEEAAQVEDGKCKNLTVIQIMQKGMKVCFNKVMEFV